MSRGGSESSNSEGAGLVAMFNKMLGKTKKCIMIIKGHSVYVNPRPSNTKLSLNSAFCRYRTRR